MKLLALTHRATVRDYIDLAAILKSGISLEHLLKIAPKKYGRSVDPMMFVRALVSFDDLDYEMPSMFDLTLKKRWKFLLKEAVKFLK